MEAFVVTTYRAPSAYWDGYVTSVYADTRRGAWVKVLVMDAKDAQYVADRLASGLYWSQVCRDAGELAECLTAR